MNDYFLYRLVGGKNMKKKEFIEMVDFVMEKYEFSEMVAGRWVLLNGSELKLCERKDPNTNETIKELIEVGENPKNRIWLLESLIKKMKDLD